MNTLLIVFAAILGVFLLYSVVVPATLNFPRFAGRMLVSCPERHVDTGLNVKPWRAAITAAYGRADLRVQRCPLLGRGERCHEGCLPRMAA